MRRSDAREAPSAAQAQPCAIRARLRDRYGPDPFRDDRGQTAVEFTGTLPVILATVILLWQAALVGYTFSLAGNAADEAVRAGTVAEGDMAAACRQAGEADLPGAWSAAVTCWTEGDLVKAEVAVNIPVLFPGFDIAVDATGESAAVRES